MRASIGSPNINNRAVFLNTAAAINAQGIDLSSAKFLVFYQGGKANAGAFGVTLSGVSVSNFNEQGMTERTIDLLGVETNIEGFGKSRRSSGIDEGSLEATVESNGELSFDVDLYNPFGSPSAKAKHIAEVLDNKRNNKTTHPADVYRKLARRMTTGFIASENDSNFDNLDRYFFNFGVQSERRGKSQNGLDQVHVKEQ